jgi:glycosyltransferase involved in cell wall biosynthesis
MNSARDPAVWFPTVRTGTGTDVFTERLAGGLAKRGIRSGITWLPLRAEYAPWTVPIPKPPAWANVAHVNTWLHPRFLPKHLPVVATIHHAVHHPDARKYKGIVRATYHRFWIAPNERRVLRRADRVVAVSRFVAETARNTLADVPMHVIYNGVDTEKFRPGNRQRKPGEPFRLLYVGSWKKLKGVDLLAPIMHELGDGFELRYTGGPAAGRYKPSMPSNMYDIGRLPSEDAVVAAMQEADALLFPSRSEGHPLVVIEAMACGLPVIANRGSSLPEVLNDEECGIMCNRDKPDAFAVAVEILRTGRCQDDGAFRKSREIAAQYFNNRSMIEAYVEIYSQLAKRAIA